MDTGVCCCSANEKIPVMIPYEDVLESYWLIACQSCEVKTEPYACKVLSTPIVLFRNSNNVIALLDSCPHRNAPLSRGKIVNGNIECPYHGWQFGKGGECQKIPGLHKTSMSSSRNARSIEAKEKYGFVWVKLSSSTHEIHPPRFLDNNSHHSFILPFEVSGSIVNILENFLDGTHTHFVHRGLVRREGKRQEITATIKRGQDRVEVKYTGEDKQSGIISRLFEKNRKESCGRFVLPSIAELEYQSNSGPELTIVAYVTPISRFSHKVHAVVSIKRGVIPGAVKQWLITPFFNKALKQDLSILELQHQNVQSFRKENFISTEIDLIRPHIIFLLNGKNKNYYKKAAILL